MYVGNGITKKFPIPEGYDGSVVILKVAGKGIRVYQGEGYVIQDGAVVFYSAVPYGVEVSFDEADASEILDRKSSTYFIIYSNGTMKQVDEAPMELIEEARKILIEAKLCSKEIEQAISDAKAYLASMLSSSGADFDGRMDGYAIAAQKAIDAAIVEAKKELTEEWAATLERLTVDTSTVRLTLEAIERVKSEIFNIVPQTAHDAKESILAECRDLLAACEELKITKSEIAIQIINAKKELTELSKNLSEEMRLKINEEIELLRSLRLNMEKDFETLNTKINNRWDMLVGELK